MDHGTKIVALGAASASSSGSSQFRVGILASARLPGSLLSAVPRAHEGHASF